MTITSFQFDPGPYDRATVALIMNRFRGDGVCYELANKLLVYANTPTAMNVLVATGGCQIQGYGMVSDAITTLTIATANATLGRIDRIVARLTPTGSPGNIALAVLTGTAASSPVAPALTQTSGGVWEIELAQVSVPAQTTSITTALITTAASQPLCAWAIPWMAGITVSQALATTLPGSLTLPNAQIHGVADPSSAQDADTKAARDAAIASATSGINQPGRLLRKTRYSSGSGTHTMSSATNYVRIIAMGAGGGGGGGGPYGGGTAGGGGGGGGGGGYAEYIRIAVSPSTGYSYSVGAGGAGGAAATAGSSGGSTTLSISGVTYSGSGGAGGAGGGTPSGGAGGAGGGNSSADIYIQGGSGGSGGSGGGAAGSGGSGGAAPGGGSGYGGGSYVVSSGGTGGAGGATSGAPGSPGSAGGSGGWLLIEEYS